MSKQLFNYFSNCYFWNKNFQKLWVSHALSQITNYLLLFLVLGRVFELTNSTVALGIMWVVYALPMFFLGPLTGTFIDCLSKRKALIYTNTLQAVIIASYALAFVTEKNYLVYALIFLYSLLNQFNNPAELALVPDLVKKKRLLLANNLLLFTDQASFVIGSSLSGILVRIFNPLWVISLTAGLTFLAGVNALFLPQDKPKIRIRHWEKALEEITQKIKEGYEFLIGHKLILYAFGLILLFQTIVAISPLILPAFSQEILHLTPYDASYLVVFPLACGLIGGTFLLNKHQNRVRKKAWIGHGLSALGTILIVFALLVSRLQRASQLSALLLSFLAGLAAAIIYAPSKTFIQEVTPPPVRGRVFGTLGFLISLATVPPSIFTTMLTELLGIRIFLVIIGTALLFLGAFIIEKGADVILAANHRA